VRSVSRTFLLTRGGNGRVQNRSGSRATVASGLGKSLAIRGRATSTPAARKRPNTTAMLARRRRGVAIKPLLGRVPRGWRIKIALPDGHT
jgi:hypothetical protein